LRANIVAMIDKQIDAATRRMLVRHDVETFEQTCGSFDPDAKAAFKGLLTAEPPKAAPVAVQGPVKAQATAKLQPPAAVTVKEKEPRKAEAHKAEPHKAEAHAVAPAAEKPARQASREPVIKEREQARPAAEQDGASDARWLDAVRGALVNHETERRAPESTAKPLGTLRVNEPAAPAPREANALPVQTPLAAPAAVQAPPVGAVPAASAPALPPPTELSAGPAKPAQPADPDHPVPPASIPMDQSNAAPAAPAVTGSTPAHTGWTNFIPFVGR
jgi:hypothetical protein